MCGAVVGTAVMWTEFISARQHAQDNDAVCCRGVAFVVGYVGVPLALSAVLISRTAVIEFDSIGGMMHVGYLIYYIVWGWSVITSPIQTVREVEMSLSKTIERWKLSIGRINTSV